MNRFSLCLLLAVLSLSANSQLNWNLNLTKPVIFTSIDPMNDPGKSTGEMWQVSVKEIMSLYNANTNSSLYGIEGNLNSDKGFVKVSVYLYDESASPQDSNTRKGPMIFQCIRDKNTDTGPYPARPENYQYGQWLAWWPDAEDNAGGFYFNDHWASTDSRSAMFAAAFHNYNNKFTNSQLIPVINGSQQNDVILPVIIEVEIYKANVTGIKIPGIGWIEPSYFRPPVLDIKIRPVAVTPQTSLIDIVIPKLPSNITLSHSIDIRYGIYDGHTTGTFSFLSADLPVSNRRAVNLIPLPGGSQFQFTAGYSVTIADKMGGRHSFQISNQYCTSFVVADPANNVDYPFSYHITRKDYGALKIYGLRGGMSAEYGVEKSIASLMGGISETWDVRKLPNGSPDLKDGGPVSVYPDPVNYDFLKRSIAETVAAYRSVFQATSPKDNVIIGTGIAHIPYLASAMRAPFLPLHFLVSVHSVEEVRLILEKAKQDGYSAFAMLGYDPSIKDIGVAWIKLTRLPPEYLALLGEIKAKNIILTGYNERVGSGEGQAKRIEMAGQSDEDFSDQSMYMMVHGAEKDYKFFYRDYDYWDYGKADNYMDWEGGISDKQVQEISAQLVAKGLNTYTIRSRDSRVFYEWALDLQKFQRAKTGLSPSKIVMNEYLVAHADYELYKGHIPYLYWQGNGVGQIAANMYDYTEYKLKGSYPGPFNTIPVYLNAKADRSLLVDSLKKRFTDVSMSTWQKADVWNPDDGMTAPCEMAAKDIVDNIGVTNYRNKLNSIAALSIDEFKNYFIPNSVKPVPSSDPSKFPAPQSSELITDIDEAGLVIRKDAYAPNTYWQPKNCPNEIEMRAFSPADGKPFPGKILGYLDGQLRPHDIRRQQITTAQFDLGNTSDEYELKMAYRFNVNKGEGLLSYDPALGAEQNMDCFEHTSIPFSHWFDIPSRMMARSGAVWIVNGGVYDFDYNGLPGVVPFVKYNGRTKALPQILSFKGEAVFGWKWGTTKSVKILSRHKDVPATGIATYLKNMFVTDVKDYPNVIGAMTYMASKDKLYDITALQPDWMKNYPPFPDYYLEANRCFFAPLSLDCGGVEVIAPIEEGWNDCAKLSNDNDIQRFSTLAYRQFQKTFDDVPNSRIFVATKGNKLDIGLIDGDFGKDDYRGKVATKSIGMHVYEESQYAIKKGYDQFVNLDGGSSAQMWLNGRGPLQMMDSYILKKDNQGPYYSRLVSSFIMLVPKLHKELINNKPLTGIEASKVPFFNNQDINFHYSDLTDLNKNKAFIDLSPCQDSLKASDGAFGYMAGNFYIRPSTKDNGGILFYAGEDMFYPETKGVYEVKPHLRNLMVMGLGMVLPSLADSLIKLPSSSGGTPSEFRNLVRGGNISFYYIKVYDGKIVDYLFEIASKDKYLDGKVHRFMVSAEPRGKRVFSIDGKNLLTTAPNIYYFDNSDNGFLNMGTTTHAYIGAVNLDGRFLTGDIVLTPFNFVFAVGKDAYTKISPYMAPIDIGLTAGNLLDFPIYSSNGIFALQCLETKGQHVFAIGKDKTFYGLRVNNSVPFSTQGANLITAQPMLKPETGSSPVPGTRK